MINNIQTYKESIERISWRLRISRFKELKTQQRNLLNLCGKKSMYDHEEREMKKINWKNLHITIPPNINQQNPPWLLLELV